MFWMWNISLRGPIKTSKLVRISFAIVNFCIIVTCIWKDCHVHQWSSKMFSKEISEMQEVNSWRLVALYMNLEDWGHYHGNSLLYDFQKKNLINTWLLPSCSLARLTVEFLFQVEESIRNFIHCCSFNTKNSKICVLKFQTKQGNGI